MRNVRLLALAALLAVICCVPAGMAAKSARTAQIRVLLISGDDIGPYHDWREISEKTREVLASSDRFDVKVCEEPLILESTAALAKYDVIVFTLYNRSTPTITAQAKENLLEYVKGGKGFRKWVMGKSGHGPRSVFKASIVNKKHPITKGMEDFRIFDELYSKLQGDEKIEVLVSADSDFSKKTEPLVFVRPYGKGRSVHNALGHDFKAIMNPSMQKLIRRGVEWAATGKVAD